MTGTAPAAGATSMFLLEGFPTFADDSTRDSGPSDVLSCGSFPSFAHSSSNNRSANEYASGGRCRGSFASALAMSCTIDGGTQLANFEIEGGQAWHSKTSWGSEVRAEATLERIVIAVNDHPISLVLGARYESLNDEVLAKIGARVVLFDRRDPRVQLDPLARR